MRYCDQDIFDLFGDFTQYRKIVPGNFYVDRGTGRRASCLFGDSDLAAWNIFDAIPDILHIDLGRTMPILYFDKANTDMIWSIGREG